MVSNAPIYDYTPYSSPYYTSKGGNFRRITGLTLAGGMIGMTMFYRPVKKDEFVEMGFKIVKDKNYQQIASLQEAAKEISENKLSTNGKMLLQDLHLPEDISAITVKCAELEKKVSDKNSVKRIKTGFADTFTSCGKSTHKMDRLSSEAFKAVKRSHMWWGIGIGAGIGLALGFLSSRNH